MDHLIRRLTSAVMVAALALALVPAAAMAAPRTDRASADARRLAQRLHAQGIHTLAIPESAPTTWAPDAYDDGDDTPAGARDMTAYLTGVNAPAGFGKASHDEAHAFYAATNESAVGAGDYTADEDWICFDVSQDDYDFAKPYMIEAQAGNAWVDPVVEVYGPTTTATIDPTAPADSVDASGFGRPDPVAVASADNGFWWWPAGLSASVNFLPPAPGRYFVRVRPNFDSTGLFEDPQSPAGYHTPLPTGAGPYTLRVKVGQMTRLAGDDRVKTAVALSRERFADGELPFFDYSVDGGGAVVLASGYNFPDALAGSTLAGAVGGPLLLTHQTYLDEAVKAEIERLGASRVYLLGSKTTLSDAVLAAAADVPGVETVTRVEGTDRVKTAAAIATEANDQYGVARLAFVASGYSFPDALAASPMAAYNVAPILLTHTAYLDTATLQAIRDLGITDVVVLGSKSTVSDAAFGTLVDELGTGHVQRIGGSDRYDTMKQFAVWATGSQGATDAVGTPAMDYESKLWALYPDGFAVAAGWNYPDALGGGAFAGGAGYPLLLNPKGENISPYILDVGGVLPAGKTAYLNFDEGSDGFIGKIGRSFILGGSSALGNGVWWGLDAQLKQTVAPEG